MGDVTKKFHDVIDGAISRSQKKFVGYNFFDETGGSSILEFFLKSPQGQNFV